jgi:hypothetical protein
MRKRGWIPDPPAGSLEGRRMGDMDTLLTRDLSLTRARVCDEVGLLRYATNHHHLFVQTEQEADDGSAD